MESRIGIVYTTVVIGVTALVCARLVTPVEFATPTAAKAEPPASPAPKQTIGNGYAELVLKRAPDSHFYADAQVNGARVRFLIDTGASRVFLTREDALRAGIGAGDFTATAKGVGGDVRLMPATVGRLAVGPLEANNVEAMVAENGLPVSLLGQSYLARIGTLSISGDTMTLR